MVPDRDYYVDKDGKLTEDPTQYARQIGVKGFALDERIAKRYGITDTLVSVDEPAAPRRVTGRNEASVKIVKADEKSDEKKAEKEESSKKPQEPAGAKAEKPAAKKEKKQS